MRTKMRTWLSYLVILLPIGYGWLNYGALPETMATHFTGVNARPDGYMTKPCLVFGLPLLMLALQVFCLTVTRLNSQHKGAAPRFERVVTWIIPLITVVTYVATITYNLGHHVDIWRVAISLVAVIFIAMGNYLPTVSATQYRQMHRGFNLRPEVWRQSKYQYGYLMVGSGVLLFLSLLTVPIVSVAILGLRISVLIFRTGRVIPCPERY